MVKHIATNWFIHLYCLTVNNWFWKCHLFKHNIISTVSR